MFLLVLLEGWKEYQVKDTGQKYYHHAATNTSTWERPNPQAGADLARQNLAACYANMGQYARALPLHEQAQASLTSPKLPPSVFANPKAP